MTVIELYCPDNPPRVIVRKVIENALALPEGGMWIAYINIDGIPAPTLAELKSLGEAELVGWAFDLRTGVLTKPGGTQITLPSNRYTRPNTAY